MANLLISQALMSHVENDPETIAAGLRCIRQWRWSTFILYFAPLPVFVICILVFEGMASHFQWSIDARGKYGDWIIGPPTFIAVITYGMTGIRACLLRCPRCGKRYHMLNGYRNPWTRKCLHCQLSLYADRMTTESNAK